MDTLQRIFNNREIAIGIWVIIALTVVMLRKSLRQPLIQFLKTAVPILFCGKFLAFYLVFIAFLLFVLDVLKWTAFWDISMLKDTIFWVLFVELPLFAKAIQDAKDNRFFTNLIAENLKFIAIFEFFVDFWTFSLKTELILIPITVIFSFLYALSSREKQHKPVKSFFEVLFAVWAIMLIGNAVYSTICHPKQLFNWNTAKALILPVVLLTLNLPVVYGLALYSGYEQLFIKIKNGAKHKGRMKLEIFCFAGLSLPRVSAIRRNLRSTIHISLNSEDMRKNLQELEHHLAMQIGDNYMKRANYYVWVCVISAIGSFVGLVLVNSEVSIKDIFLFNFVLNISRIKEIITYILSVSLVFGVAMLFYAIGLRKKKNEEISQIKKYAIFDFLFTLKKQKSQLQEYPPIDDPVSIYVNYMQIAYELKETCTKALDVYGNLLNAWERESIESLQTSIIRLLANISIGGGDFSNYDVKSFCEYYKTKAATSQYNEKYNTFTGPIKGDVEKYTKSIEATYEDFKRYYE